MKETDKPVANPDLVFREEFDDWAVLFDPDTGDGFGMNPVSVFIWKCLNGKNTVADIKKQVLTECEDAPDDAETHIHEFLEELVKRGFAGFEV